MKTLINKRNPLIRITAPEITTAHPPVSNEGYVYWIPAINEMYNPIEWTLVEEEQKLAEWSDEDEDNLCRVIRVLEDNDSDWEELSNWLKSLKERMKGE